MPLSLCNSAKTTTFALATRVYAPLAKAATEIFHQVERLVSALATLRLRFWEFLLVLHLYIAIYILCGYIILAIFSSKQPNWIGRLRSILMVGWWRKVQQYSVDWSMVVWHACIVPFPSAHYVSVACLSSPHRKVYAFKFTARLRQTILMHSVECIR